MKSIKWLFQETYIPGITALVLGFLFFILVFTEVIPTSWTKYYEGF